MPREIVTIECTEARKEGKSPSRYTTTRNKKLKTEKLEIRKYNPALRRHTLHRGWLSFASRRKMEGHHLRQRRILSKRQMAHHANPVRKKCYL